MKFPPINLININSPFGTYLGFQPLIERFYNQINYYFWSDGTWCIEEDLDDYLLFMSDDYVIIKASNNDEAIDKFERFNNA